MKYKANFRQIFITLTLISLLCIIEKIRVRNQHGINKNDKKVTNESGFNTSNTDFIFLESLSKYLFLAIDK